MTDKQFLHPKSQAGQAIVLLTLMMIVLLGAVGFAVDGGQAYYYSTKIEIAAGSAAMAGVVYMPNQFSPSQASPAGSKNDATDVAVAMAYLNGFQNGVNGVSVTSAQVIGHPNRLSVTVTKNVPTFFMQIFGVKTISVTRTSVAVYQPPISLGQSGPQLGSTTAQLGSGGNNYFFTRTEGWAVDRGHGDAYTPNPATQLSTDVHVISSQAGNDTGTGVAGLPARGGYNYMINLPNGGYIQVYNAAFGPDDASAALGYNHCDNHVNPSLASFDSCSSGGTYYLHEEDNIILGNPSEYGAMEYTVLSVANSFTRSSDKLVSQVKVLPVFAGNWDGSYNSGIQGCPNACNIPSAYTEQYDSNATAIDQKYDGTGYPTNMRTYHQWVDITGANYSGGSDGGTWKQMTTSTYGVNRPLPAGIYRLRVDSLNNDGTNPPGGSNAHKAYDVRVVDTLAGLKAATPTCAGCSVSAMSDMATYTPVALPNGGIFQMSLFQLSPDYAGQTISVDIFDAGDMAGIGSIYLGFINPAQCGVACPGLLSEPSGGPSASVYDIGSSRSNYPNNATLLNTFPPGTGVEQIATQNGTLLADNKWYHFIIPIPANYNPGNNPANWWWSFQYRSTAGVTANDTVTFAAGLQGNPVHLLSS